MPRRNAAERLEVLSRTLVLVVGGLAAVVLTIGWGFDVSAVRRIHPAFAAMVPSTAICLLVASSAFLWFSAKDSSKRRLILRMGAGAIAVIAIADILVIVTGAANGIDTFFAPSHAAFQESRMATATATNFVLLALALVVLPQEKSGFQLAFVSAATVGLIFSIVAVVGYIFDAAALYGVPGFTAMALHTALAFMGLFAALLMYRHDIGWVSILRGEEGGSAAARLLLPGAIILPFALCYVALMFTKAGMLNANFRLSVLAILMMGLLSATALGYAVVQNRIERQLRTAIADRDLLLREVYHRVKNNLQMTTALLMSGAARVKDTDARALLYGTTKRIEALGTVHRLLISSRMPSEVDAKEFLQDLCDNIVSGHREPGKDIALDIAVDPGAVHIDFAVALGLLTNELVTNALKHGFEGKDGGTISVRYRQKPERGVSLTVADDGIGAAGLFEEEAIAGAGSRIVRGLVRQLGAEMTVGARQGTVVVINVPASAMEGAEYE